MPMDNRDTNNNTSTNSNQRRHTSSVDSLSKELDHDRGHTNIIWETVKTQMEGLDSNMYDAINGEIKSGSIIIEDEEVGKEADGLVYTPCRSNSCGSSTNTKEANELHQQGEKEGDGFSKGHEPNSTSCVLPCYENQKEECNTIPHPIEKEEKFEETKRSISDDEMMSNVVDSIENVKALMATYRAQIDQMHQEVTEFVIRDVEEENSMSKLANTVLEEQKKALNDPVYIRWASMNKKGEFAHDYGNSRREESSKEYENYGLLWAKEALRMFSSCDESIFTDNHHNINNSIMSPRPPKPIIFTLDDMDRKVLDVLRGYSGNVSPSEEVRLKLREYILHAIVRAQSDNYDSGNNDYNSEYNTKNIETNEPKRFVLPYCDCDGVDYEGGEKGISWLFYLNGRMLWPSTADVPIPIQSEQSVNNDESNKNKWTNDDNGGNYSTTNNRTQNHMGGTEHRANMLEALDEFSSCSSRTSITQILPEAVYQVWYKYLTSTATGLFSFECGDELIDDLVMALCDVRGRTSCGAEVRDDGNCVALVPVRTTIHNNINTIIMRSFSLKGEVRALDTQGPPSLNPFIIPTIPTNSETESWTNEGDNDSTTAANTAGKAVVRATKWLLHKLQSSSTQEPVNSCAKGHLLNENDEIDKHTKKSLTWTPPVNTVYTWAVELARCNDNMEIISAHENPATMVKTDHISHFSVRRIAILDARVLSPSNALFGEKRSSECLQWTDLCGLAKRQDYDMRDHASINNNEKAQTKDEEEREFQAILFKYPSRSLVALEPYDNTSACWFPLLNKWMKKYREKILKKSWTESNCDTDTATTTHDQKASIDHHENELSSNDNKGTSKGLNVLCNETITLSKTKNEDTDPTNSTNTNKANDSTIYHLRNYEIFLGALVITIVSATMGYYAQSRN